MNLSKIVKSEKLKYGTIIIDKEGKIECTLYLFSDNKKGYSIITKKYSSLKIDEEVRDTNIDSVKHLGYVRYRVY